MWWTLPGDWPAPREPLDSEREVPEPHVTGAEGMGQWRVIGGIVVLEGNEAECHVHNKGQNETIAGDSANCAMDGVEPIAEGPKK